MFKGCAASLSKQHDEHLQRPPQTEKNHDTYTHKPHSPPTHLGFVIFPSPQEEAVKFQNYYSQ